MEEPLEFFSAYLLFQGLGLCHRHITQYFLFTQQNGKENNLWYYSISFNLAPSMMCYQLPKILISAGPRFDHDIQLFSAGRVNFVLEATGAMCADGLYQ